MSHMRHPAMDELAVIVTKQLELEAIQFGQTRGFDGRQLLARTRVEWLNEARNIGIHLLHYVYGRRAEEVVSYPATWWDGFKLRFFPRWAIRRWPARYARIVIKAMALFPELQARGLRNQVIVYRAERGEK
jgi:hypothetical protein